MNCCSSQVAQKLDREEADVHFLVVQASEDCVSPPLVNNSLLDHRDNTMLRVIVFVNDINDNAPQFVKEVFTGGVTTDADFGTEFMQVRVRWQQYVVSCFKLEECNVNDIRNKINIRRLIFVCWKWLTFTILEVSLNTKRLYELMLHCILPYFILNKTNFAPRLSSERGNSLGIIYLTTI